LILLTAMIFRDVTSMFAQGLLCVYSRSELPLLFFLRSEWIERVRCLACYYFPMKLLFWYLWCRPSAWRTSCELHSIKNKQTNSRALVRQRTIPTEQPPLVGEVSANFRG
jgi:hypothetical protein